MYRDPLSVCKKLRMVGVLGGRRNLGGRERGGGGEEGRERERKMVFTTLSLSLNCGSQPQKTDRTV